MAEKAGLESVLALTIMGGALAVASILYILKKTEAFNFLKLGFPGIRVFLISFPYDYLALFLVTLILGSYIVQKLNFSLGIKNSFNIPATALLVVIVFLGSFFAVMGGGQLSKGFYADRSLPKEIAAEGIIVSVNNEEVVIQKKDGGLESIVFGDGKIFPYASDYAIGKIMRAVGRPDPGNPGHFRAESISCCE